ncbi:hypothetical protein TSTA_051500 [Talaromyces stipitatus ATCC 10500]|uniref:Uncharacterized protein n=1 Tax=Talaromyces stipitatus (strain ATCC 10500 / CBS 375.48 / QM 6759 / NRRL 1006) TaxID=441959 RepID=B8MJ52_TALSN|nr:uncharacterized protein TSTA_051500 [Talaromyces stipitatus ATCC 10500]EED15714.1 hypothetical protein TSTA_051500 [Talaromyces stipitatus ATCC 10500]
MNYQHVLSALRDLRPLGDDELEQIITYTNSLDDTEAARHLENLLGDSPRSLDLISSFLGGRSILSTEVAESTVNSIDTSHGASSGMNFKEIVHDTESHPPPYAMILDSRNVSRLTTGRHTNAFIEASRLRARDEVRYVRSVIIIDELRQNMIQLLQQVQLENGIYNSEIEPEHEVDYPCACSIHQYKLRKLGRLALQERWSKAVMYPVQMNTSLESGLRMVIDSKFLLREECL